MQYGCTVYFVMWFKTILEMASMHCGGGGEDCVIQGALIVTRTQTLLGRHIVFPLYISRNEYHSPQGSSWTTPRNRWWNHTSVYTWKWKPYHISPILLITESRRCDHCCRSYGRVELQISLLRWWSASTVGLPHAAWDILIFVGSTWQRMLRRRCTDVVVFRPESLKICSSQMSIIWLQEQNSGTLFRFEEIVK